MRANKILGILGWIVIVMIAACLSGCDFYKKATEQEQEVNQSSEQVVSEQKSGSHPGKMLHDTNCISCHDATKYEVTGRKVSDFPALLAQVKRCNANLNPGLADKEIAQVADYLNQNFYRYEK